SALGVSGTHTLVLAVRGEHPDAIGGIGGGALLGRVERGHSVRFEDTPEVLRVGEARKLDAHRIFFDLGELLRERVFRRVGHGPSSTSRRRRRRWVLRAATLRAARAPLEWRPGV